MGVNWLASATERMRSWVLIPLLIIACVGFSDGAATSSGAKQSSAGSAATPNPANTSAVTDVFSACYPLTTQAKQDFSDFRYFKLYEKQRLPQPYKAAGLQHCEDLRWAYQCFQHATDDLGPGVAFKYPREYNELQSILSKFCESEWSDGKSCRMADARICDFKFNKNLCKDDLQKYKQCVEDTLKDSDQDCSGVCTPARRFHKDSIYQWDMECMLKEAIDQRCNDYATLYCIGPLKDAELSWGIWENIQDNKNLSNLAFGCEDLLEWPIECFNSTLTENLDYFGFNISKICKDVSDSVKILQKQWEEIVHPLCKGRPKGKDNLQELCGVAPTTQRIPSTVPTTTEQTQFERRKIKKGLRSKASIMSIPLSFISAMAAFVICFQR